jgi:glycine cleavage system H protein
MSDANIPEGLRYTKDHEWAQTKQGSAGSEVTVGITAFAVEQLGDITLVNLDVKAGDPVTAGKAFGTIESVKTLSDLYAPVTGKVVAVNGELESKPEAVNEDTYGKGWMIVIAPADPKEVSGLMDSKAYAEHCKTEASH